MECPMCGAATADDATECPTCTATLRFAAPIQTAATNNPIRNPVVEQVGDEAAEDRTWERYNRSRHRNHAITGILTFALLSILLGLPESLSPLSLLKILAASTLMGAPIGYLISRVGGNWKKGALISSLAFTVLFLILSGGEGSLLSNLGVGAFVGFVPGAIIGWHVEMSGA